MIKKISDIDKKTWQDFISKKEKLPDKDLLLKKDEKRKSIKTIDLHGFTLERANQAIKGFINKCFLEKTYRIIVITGKGLRSKNISDPYVSKDLSILKHSVPQYIRSDKELMNIISEIKEANIEDGGSGAFYVYLKKSIK